MSAKQLRARLTKLEHSAQQRNVKTQTPKAYYEFPIEPAVLKAMADDYSRLIEITCSWFVDPRPYPSSFPPEGREGYEKVIARLKLNTPPTWPSEADEIRARIAERAKTIKCPPYYGFKEHWMDYAKYIYWGVACDLPEEEKLQAKVRMEVFKQTPEGQARCRIDYLEDGYLSHAKCEEMIQLLKIYPEPWVDPRSINDVRSIEDRRTPEALRRRADKDQRWIDQRKEELQRKNGTKK
jgi:hypothetical protein